ncbi:hypothetical protein FQN57_006276 [Myotisia sp. PD_48]|nr:hypothetical protein FQN57_006276 [Myotisia sp. PD_48]
MSSTLRANSPSPDSSRHSRPRPRLTPKLSGNPAFHLGSLPRFHPAVYQSPASSNTGDGPSFLTPTSAPLTTSSPSSAHYNHHYQQYPSQQSRVMPSTNSRDALRQYRDFVTGITLTSRPQLNPSLSTNPSQPRLVPLGSPGPVTPLALEDEEGEYLTAGAARTVSTADDHRGTLSREDYLQQLLQSEYDRMAHSIHRDNPSGRR